MQSRNFARARLPIEMPPISVYGYVRQIITSTTKETNGKGRYDVAGNRIAYASRARSQKSYASFGTSVRKCIIRSATTRWRTNTGDIWCSRLLKNDRMSVPGWKTFITRRSAKSVSWLHISWPGMKARSIAIPPIAIGRAAEKARNSRHDLSPLVEKYPHKHRLKFPVIGSWLLPIDVFDRTRSSHWHRDQKDRIGAYDQQRPGLTIKRKEATWTIKTRSAM